MVSLGYIDTSGNIVIPIQFNKAESFHDGIAKVSLFDDKNAPYDAYINTDGKVIFDYRN